MEHKDLLVLMAPCSLLCYTCGAYEKGIIPKRASELSRYLEVVYEFYDHHPSDEKQNQLERFRIFMEELERYSKGSCGGCRGGGHNECSIKGCFIARVHC